MEELILKYKETEEKISQEVMSLIGGSEANLEKYTKDYISEKYNIKEGDVVLIRGDWGNYLGLIKTIEPASLLNIIRAIYFGSYSYRNYIQSDYNYIPSLYCDVYTQTGTVYKNRHMNIRYVCDVIKVVGSEKDVTTVKDRLKLIRRFKSDLEKVYPANEY